MELYCNTSNRMTRWLVSTGALTTPFVLVDVGVQGGISPRWNALQDHLKVYGFDLLEEAIAPLVRAADTRHQYFAMGLADHDGELDIVIPANPFETQLYGSGAGERRRVQIRRLDTVFNEHTIRAADFIKMDCEGHEPLVLRGAAAYIAASNLVGADIESSFNLSPLVPNTQFCESCDQLVRQRLLVFDLEFDRVPVVDLPWLAGRFSHRPATLNVLFARNLMQERDSGPSYVHRPPERPVDPQTVLKSAIVFESYGLLDWAFYVLKNFANEIGAAVDVDAAIAQLEVPMGSAMPTPRSSARVRHPTNWRITNALRTTKRYLLRKLA
jgi:FkbM family methyltransferase